MSIFSTRDPTLAFLTAKEAEGWLLDYLFNELPPSINLSIKDKYKGMTPSIFLPNIDNWADVFEGVGASRGSSSWARRQDQWMVSKTPPLFITPCLEITKEPSRGRVHISASFYHKRKNC